MNREDGAPLQDGTVNSEAANESPPKEKSTTKYSCEVSGQQWLDSTAYANDYYTKGDGAPR